MFEEKGRCVPEIKISLQHQEGAKSVFTPERNAPHVLQKLCNKDDLDSSGIITPVNCSDQGSPLVDILKPNASV